MSALDTLYQTIFDQTQAINDRPAAPWQDELMAHVDPAAAKSRNIAHALATAAQALATTPGNFLTGLSASAASGANSYITGRDQAAMDRIKAMQTVDEAQRQQQGDALGRLRSLFGLQNTIDTNQYNRERNKMLDDRYQAQTDYSHQQDERNYQLRKQNSDALNSYRATRAEIAAAKAGIDSAIGGVPKSGLLTPNQRNNALTAINRLSEARRKEGMKTAWTDQDRLRVDREAEDFRQKLLREYDITDLPAKTPAIPKGATADESVLAAPPPLEGREVGKTYNTPRGPATWTGSGWQLQAQ